MIDFLLAVSAVALAIIGCMLILADSLGMAAICFLAAALVACIEDRIASDRFARKPAVWPERGRYDI